MTEAEKSLARELGKLERKTLVAGDYPAKTEAIEINGPIELKIGDVLSTGGPRSFALVDSAHYLEERKKPIGILCDDVTADEGETAVANMYVKGEFASRALNFGGTDTVETHKRRMTEIGLIVRETKAEGGEF